MIREFRSILLVLLITATLAGCDSQEQQNNFVDDAGLAPSGFARTDDTGRILDDDMDDWRTAPVFAGKVRFDPAYPNPVGGEFVTIPVTVLEFNAVQGGLVVRARDGAGDLRLLDEIPTTSDPGAYVFRFSPVILARDGLVRVFIFDTLGELVTYGDLQLD